MTNKNKTLSTLAAVGMTLYAAHWFAHRIPAVRKFAHSLLPTATVYDDAYYHRRPIGRHGLYECA